MQLTHHTEPIPVNLPIKIANDIPITHAVIEHDMVQYVLHMTVQRDLTDAVPHQYRHIDDPDATAQYLTDRAALVAAVIQVFIGPTAYPIAPPNDLGEVTISYGLGNTILAPETAMQRAVKHTKVLEYATSPQLIEELSAALYQCDLQPNVTAHAVLEDALGTQAMFDTIEAIHETIIDAMYEHATSTKLTNDDGSPITVWYAEGQRDLLTTALKRFYLAYVQDFHAMTAGERNMAAELCGKILLDHPATRTQGIIAETLADTLTQEVSMTRIEYAIRYQFPNLSRTSGMTQLTSTTTGQHGKINFAADAIRSLQILDYYPLTT